MSSRAKPESADLGALPPSFPTEGATEAFSAQSREDDPSLSRTLLPAEGERQAAAAPVAVPGYEILREIGRGGMGVVYQARQLQLNRVVALKMILGGGHAGATDLARFLAEAEAVAQLQHAHIVQIFETGHHDGLPYFTLEFVPGGTLADRVREAPLPPREAAHLVEQLARGVAYAHQHGVIHRDLKPENVLMGEDGTPKITDFGLAKRVQEAGSLTATGTVMGTPSYMAPEQAGGKSSGVTTAIDVYALGAILYRLLTGRPPFQAATPLETILHVVADEPVPPRQLQPSLPRDLATICLKCLRKEPARRYASAAALADDLGRFLRDEPIEARPVGRMERAWRWARRNPTLAGLLGVIAAGVLVAVFLLYQERDRTLRNLRRAESAEREKTEELWKSLVAQAEAERFSGRVGQRFKSLAALKDAADLARRQGWDGERLERLRDLAIACLALPDVRMGKEWDGWLEGTVAVELDPEGERYARADAQGNVSVRRVDDDTELARLPGEGQQVQVSFSPDGSFLLLHEQGTGRIRGWRPGEEKPFFAIQEGKPVGVYLSPDCRMLAAGYADGVIGLHEIPSARLSQKLRLPASCGHLAFQPHGRLVAAGSGGYPTGLTVYVFDRETGQPQGQFTLPNHVQELAWYPDGQTLVASCTDYSTVHLFKVPAFKEVQALRDLPGGAPVLSVNRTGDLLAATATWTGASKVWHARTGKVLLGMPTGTLHFRFAPADGRLLALEREGRRLRLWEVIPGREFRTLPQAPDLLAGGLQTPAVSPDGRLLAVGSFEGVAFWDLAGGRQIHLLRLPRTYSVAFDSSGDLLTFGLVGLQRWPIRVVGGTYHIGAPHSFGTHGAINNLAATPDGRVVAACVFQRTEVFHRDRPVPIVLGPHRDARSVAVSPDGRLVATGEFGGKRIDVWDAATGQHLRALSCPSSNVDFSPDGKWLASEERLWEVDTWRERPPLRGRFYQSHGFSPRDGLLALSLPALALLVDPESGKELARLEAPNQTGASCRTFSPDGTKLIYSNNESGAIHVWDLRALRRGLAELGLDWEAPPYPPEEKGPAFAAPLTVTVDKDQPSPPQVGPAIALPPTPPKRRAATPAQVAGWIRELQGANSKAAEQALVEVGLPALDALEKAAQQAGEGRRQLESVLERLEVLEALAPPRVTLKLREATVGEAVQALSSQGPLPLSYSLPQGPKPGNAQVLTLQLVDVPFWEALERVCREAHLTWGPWYQPGGEPGLRLQPGELPASGVCAHAGPLCIQPAGWSYHRSLNLQGTARPVEQLLLNLTVLAGKQRWPLVLQRLAVRDAEDQTGQHLVALAPNFDQPQELGGPNVRRPISLQAPAALGGRLKYLKGVAEVEVPTRQRLLVSLAGLKPGTTACTWEGLRLTVRHANRFGTQLQLGLEVTGNAELLKSKQLALELVDGQGRSQRPQAFWNNSPTGRELEPERLAVLAVSSQPFPAALPWSGFALAGRPVQPRQRLVADVFLALPRDFGTELKVKLYTFRRTRAELPFELRDLPLP